MHRFLAPTALALLLGACANYSTAGTTPTKFDGVYAGTVNQTHVAASSCASTEPMPGQLLVQNGTVEWKDSPIGTLYAPIAPNGSFAANSAVPNSNAQVWFTGKITNQEMVARTNTGSCHRIYDLRKSTQPS